MPKKNKKVSWTGLVEKYVPPVIAAVIDLVGSEPNLDTQESQAIDDVIEAKGSKVLVYSHWEGHGRAWNLGAMDDTDAEYEGLVREMLDATDRSEMFESLIIKYDGSIYELRGEAVKIKYVLEPYL
jgi:hypothetical protein